MSLFTERLDDAARRNQSLVCVGLDPWRPSMPIDDFAEFSPIEFVDALLG